MDPEAVVAAIGARRHGVVRAGEALAVGVSDEQLRRLRRTRGVLVGIGRGVDRLRDHPFDLTSRCQAALDLAGDSAVLGLRTAARLHGFYAHRSSDAVEVLVPRGIDHRTAVGRLVQTRWLPQEHVTELEGFPVTTTARTFFDLCGDPEPGVRLSSTYHRRHMEAVYNDALGRRGMTFTQEAAVFSVMARRGRSGTRLGREILERFGPDHQPTMSDTETLFLQLVETYGLPTPERQVPISGPDGWIATVDFLFDPAKHIVEVDSGWHDGPLDRERDAERDRCLAEAGYSIARYRYGDLVRTSATVARELEAAVGHICQVLPPER
jgi:very-short-patch-repair endonuclease